MHNKEPYENMKILMEVINYDKFKWQICGDLKWMPYYLDYNKDSQNIAASFMNGTAELGLFITQKNIGLPEKAMNQGEAAFTYLWEEFPRLGEGKLKGYSFIGPKIRELIKDE